MLILKNFLICALVSSMGFIRMIYFITYGYGFSITVMGFILLLLYKDSTLDEKILGILYIIYGLRLTIFLLIRNYKSSYLNKMKGRIKEHKDFKLFVLIMIWISCALLYACQTSPLAYKLISEKKEKKFSYIGIVIAIFGLLLEIEADNQKSRAKKLNPNKFVESGLYKIVRCPNYLGEIIFWIGNFVCGIKIYNGFIQWFITKIGLGGIIFIMFAGARRIEIQQKKSYSDDKNFKEYIKKTPLLIPFVPIYTLEKYWWLRG